MHLINRHLFSRIYTHSAKRRQPTIHQYERRGMAINQFIRNCYQNGVPAGACAGVRKTRSSTDHCAGTSSARRLGRRMRRRESERGAGERGTRDEIHRVCLLRTNGLSSSCVRCHCVLARSLRIIRQASRKSCGVMANDLVPCCSRSAASNPTKGKVRWDEPPPLIQLRFASWKSPTR